MANKKYLQLPRAYISYSQIDMWKKDPKRYKEIYFNNRPEFRIESASMDYGKKFADALEHKKETNELFTDAAILLLPKYDVRDKEMFGEIKTPDGWIKIIGRPDTYNSKTHHFREYKTGKGKWTYQKAQRHPQMPFYAMIIYLNTGVALKEAYLDWVETRSSVDGKIEPTGKIENFKVQIGLKRILETMADTIKVAKEIESAYASHITKPSQPW